MSTFPAVLVRLKRLLQQLRTMPVGQYSSTGRYRLRHLLTATIEALHALYASPLRYVELFRYQLVLHQMQLVQQALSLTATLNADLVVHGPSGAVWQQTHELLLHVLTTTLATPPLS